LLTTNPQDLEEYEEDIFEVGNGENIKMRDIEEKGEELSKSTINFLAKQASLVDR
jgi:hypothetical protein